MSNKASRHDWLWHEPKCGQRQCQKCGMIRSKLIEHCKIPPCQLFEPKPDNEGLLVDKEAFSYLFRSYEEYLDKVFDRVLPRSDRKTLLDRSVDDRERVVTRTLKALVALGYTRTAKAQRDLTRAECREKIEEIFEFIDWLRDEELVAQDDWGEHCEAKYQALKAECLGGK